MVLLDGSVSYFKIVATALTVILGERFSCGHVGGNRIKVEKMCHTSYCGDLALIQILGEDLFTEIRLLV